MKIKEYIESGILEEYALGLLSEQEQQAVSRMAETHPEVKAEISKLEESLQEYAFAHAKTPPNNLKERIFEGLVFEKKSDEDTDTIAKQTAIIAPLWPKIAVAASIILTLGMLYSLFQLQQSNQDNDNLSQKIDVLSSKIDQKESLISLYQNKDMLPVTLNGVKSKESHSAQIFWDKANQEVILHINNLPKPIASQQYQLWRIVDGKPVDMGVVADDYDSKLVHFKSVDKAAAFAITLEKRGGNPTPTMEQMVVMGGV